MICGTSLLIDSVINFVIQFLYDDLKTQCVLGIITTSSFFYIAWGTIALRAYRVKAVFDTYDGYLKELTDCENSKIDSNNENLLSLVTYNYERYDMSSPLPKKISTHTEDKKEFNKNNLDRLGKLQEWALIKRFSFFFILPNLVIGSGALKFW
jgi:hypothetical protein